MTDVHDADALRETAARLHGAHRTGKPVGSPSREGAVTTLADAYRVQAEVLRLHTAPGRRITGLKAGLTSVTARRAVEGATEPVLGRLTDGMFRTGRLLLDSGELIRPRAEPALLFVLGAPLEGPRVSAVDALRAVEFVLPALEITDSRVEDGPATVLDLAADNAGCHAVVLGTEPVRPADTDLRLTGHVLYRDGAIVATGATGMALGSPVAALAWAANARENEGEFPLTAGSSVLVSGFATPTDLLPGSTVTASLAGLGTATVTRSR
ncbi:MULTISPECIES: 2-keto-4-pentenoate hydratase [unclassified Streptomyces]|uniref:2-keto-4-pentenoate hydratase n=1 Tax=unclassified Streptomyces TaxID=2593676 RepID=UPI0037B50DBE